MLKNKLTFIATISAGTPKLFNDGTDRWLRELCFVPKKFKYTFCVSCLLYTTKISKFDVCLFTTKQNKQASIIDHSLFVVTNKQTKSRSVPVW